MQQPTTITGHPPSLGTTAETDHWLGPGRFSLVLGLLVFAAFPQVLLGLETFVIRDYGFFAYPLAHYQRECFWRGELPLWDPYNICGIPFLAQWNTMALYPPALVYLLLPLSWSLSFFCLLHLFWAGLGMYFLAHRWSGNRLAAAVAGVIFTFNGFSLNLLMWPSHIATFSWMPWVIWLVERGWQRGGRSLVLAALAGALQMLAGGPETILFTWLILLAMWLLELRKARPFSATPDVAATLSPAVSGIPRMAALVRFPVIVLLVAGLAAVQLCPFLDLAAHSQREAGFADARWSMPSWGWANFLVPMLFGSHAKQNLFFQYGQYWTSSYYLGVGALLLSGFALWKVRRRGVWFLAAIALTGLVLAGGNNNIVSRWLRQIVPQLSLMTYPIKYIALTIFSAPLLAGFAVARLRNTPAGERRKAMRLLGLIGAALVLVISGILCFAWRSPFPTDDFRATLTNGVGRAVFVLFSTAVAVGLLRTGPTPWQRLLPLSLLLVLWVDVWTHEPPQNPTVPPGMVYQPNLARQYLAMQPQPALGGSRAMLAPATAVKFTQLALNSPKDNYVAKRLGYFADCNALDDVPKVDGFFSLYPREAGELNSVLYLEIKPCPPRLADFLSVSQVTADDANVRWQPRDSYLPLATAGQQPIFMDDTNALFTMLDPQFDPGKFVVLPLGMKDFVSATNRTQAVVNLKRFEAQRVDLDVEAAEPSLVVLSQSYYHQWRARIDGKPARLFRANYAFQAVQVTRGTHLVQLTYEDHALYAGGIISSLTFLVCAIGWVRCRAPL